MVATKQRMVEAAAGLLRARGLSGTSFTEVVAASGAARGVIYHHFPGGKNELARDAVAWTGESVRDRLALIDAEDAAGVVEEFLAAVRPQVEQSAGGVGCAVAAVTIESAQLDPDLTKVANTALTSWVTVVEARLRKAGAGDAAAAALSVLLVGFLEGSYVLCRAAGSVEPFDRGRIAISAAAEALLAPGRLNGRT